MILILLISVLGPFLISSNINAYQAHPITKQKIISPKETVCPRLSFRCSNRICRSKYFTCDGYQNCGDYSDKENCALVCPRAKYECSNGKHIDRRWICDGDNDCFDNSDESNCSTICSKRMFRCPNGNCIERDWVCDGLDDCLENSDEINCGKTCRSLPFNCRYGRIRFDDYGVSKCVNDTDESVSVSDKPVIIMSAASFTNPSTLTTASSNLTTEEEASFNSTESDCATTYCLNGGECKIVDSVRMCRCPISYEGKICQHIVEHKKCISATNQNLIISLSVVVFVLAIISIGLSFHLLKIILNRKREFAVSFHQPQQSDDNYKLLKSENVYSEIQLDKI